ncbi:uncharacterized protein PAC_02249 [Phialocephala subalpina]|uniref:Uncharacterized protein n=1 Tax=Phialocephala subalpina TaxID=576137 RepID=A0A1L7WHY9_9HELO|nr:uncharacterized protein PAC_02249 [Phialocephala subalpina]
MSQTSSQALDPDWVSLSIVKFSHNTSPYGTKTYTWSHISTRPDLDIVIRNARCVDEQGKHDTRVIMKVSAGADVMETQDLLELVRFCQQFNPSTGAEHPVEIAIKSPFLAMRYPKTVNTVRRLQIKFRNHEDFQTAYNFLKDLGLPISSKETTASPNPQPVPSPAPSIAASTASSSTLVRPSSAALPSTYNGGPASSPLKSEFRIPPRPDSTMSEDRARVNDLPFQGHSTPQPTSMVSISRTQSNNVPFQVHSSTRPELVSSIDRAHTSDPLFSRAIHPAIIPNPTLSRVNSFQIPAMQSPMFYSSQVEGESRHFSHPASQVSDPAKPTTGTHPRTSLYIDQLQSLRQEGTEKLESQSLSASRFFPSPAQPSVGDQGTSNPFIAWDNQKFQRPASTPVASTTTSTLILPPKRILPFPRPEESAKSRISSLSDLPQISKATPAILPTSVSPMNSACEKLSTPASKPAPKKRVAQRKAPATKPAEDASKKAKPDFEEIVIAEPQLVTEEPSPLAAKSAAAVARPASTPLSLVSKVAPPPKKRVATPAIRPASSNKRPKMVDQTTQTQDPPAQQENKAQNRISHSSASTPNTSSNSVSSPPDDYLEDVDAFIVKHKARPPPKEIWDTPGWADADDEYRERLINHFICENLENPDFLKLCEDMGTSWRRIGLGF